MVKKTIFCLFLFGATLLQASSKSTEFDVYFSEIGAHFDIPPLLLKKIATVESSLNPNCININNNKTIDYGIMQINSVHFEELSKHGINESNIMSPRVNILAAALLLKRLTKESGLKMDKIGNYHSKTPVFKYIWSDKLARELAKSF